MSGTAVNAYKIFTAFLNVYNCSNSKKSMKSSVLDLSLEFELSHVLVTSFQLTTQHLHLGLELRPTLFTLVH